MWKTHFLVDGRDFRLMQQNHAVPIDFVVSTKNSLNQRICMYIQTFSLIQSNKCLSVHFTFHRLELRLSDSRNVIRRSIATIVTGLISRSFLLVFQFPWGKLRSYDIGEPVKLFLFLFIPGTKVRAIDLRVK